MIVKMKKVLLITMLRYKREALELLRNLGVVHVEPYNSSSESLKKSIENRDILVQALSLLDGDSEVKTLKSINENFLDIAKGIIYLHSEIKEFNESRNSLIHKKQVIVHWGNFSISAVNQLKENGIYIQFFKTQMSEFKALVKNPEIKVALISDFKGTAYFITVSESKQTLENADEYEFETDFEFLKNKIKVIDEVLEQKVTQLSLFNKYKDVLRSEIRTYNEIVDFEQVNADMQTEENSFSYITGFIPINKLEVFEASVSNMGFAYKILEPNDEDKIPTYVERKGFSKLATPIFDVLETIPGYKERDVSFLFMVFFFVFFGMIIGDAAYGTIFFLTGIILSLMNIVKRKPLTSVHALMLYLSTSAIIYGAMTGNWFGSPVVLDYLPFLKMFKVEYLTGKDSMQNVMFICFTIGVIQIASAHVWNFLREIKEKPHIHAIAQLGWLIAIIGLYYLVLNLILGQSRFPMSNIVLNMIYTGIALVFIFCKQDGSNFFLCILKSLQGIIEQFLSIVSSFADIISYIRLFAVGLAGLSISESFNLMSGSLLNSGNIGLIIAGIIIILFGHVLNITLSLLSVVVHGVRLNMLEFSNHLGQEWSGHIYRPFKKIEK